MVNSEIRQFTLFPCAYFEKGKAILNPFGGWDEGSLQFCGQ